MLSDDTGDSCRLLMPRRSGRGAADDDEVGAEDVRVSSVRGGAGNLEGGDLTSIVFWAFEGTLLYDEDELIVVERPANILDWGHNSIFLEIVRLN